MAETNPITRLYKDIITILNTLTIKYGYRADACETLESKSRGDRYICALAGNDSYTMYDDYTHDDFISAGITDEKLIKEYTENRFAVPVSYRNALLNARRKREIDTYEEKNNYYRMLSGYPDVEDTNYFYVPEDVASEFGLPTDIPVHLMTDDNGDYNLNSLITSGYLDTLIKEHPDKEYLKHIGSNRISIQYARQAKNFSILAVNQTEIMESTYREFIRSYEKARVYFISTAYTYEFRDIIPYYDNFIALCIFVMAIQQVSVRSIENAIQREFYDEYMVQLLYETYGVPFFDRIDTETQKLLVQNLNMLVQNKATTKVLIDIASILGFNDISIFQYYLVKERLFDDKGLPIIKKKKKVNTATGKVEEVYDYKAMYDLYFQKVGIDETNIKKALLSSNNRVDYNNVVYYDPYWWEDDELTSEIWDREYNYLETKYLGATIPYRLTDTLFDSIVVLRIIMENFDKYSSISISIPRITTEKVSLTDAVYLFLALMAKKLHVNGQIISTPSKLIHVLETIGQQIDKSEKHIEALSFNFDAFSPERIAETRDILAPYFSRRKYRIVNGHDVDLNPDGSQNAWGPTKLVAFDVDTTDLDTFMGYLFELSTTSGSSQSERINAINNIYKNSRALYEFLSYQMSQTTNPDEYYALKKFYDTVFYTNEIDAAFRIKTEDGYRTANTFEEYFLYTNGDIYKFIQNVKADDVYSYIDHIIFKISDVCNSFSSLYILNDGSSPLLELLEILMNFFKSYRMDFAELSSVMVVDWEMENTIRFFASPHSIKKTDVIEEKLGTDFLDHIHKFIARYSIEDRIELSEYLHATAKLHVEDGFSLEDLYDYMHAIKTYAVEDEFITMDYVSGLKGTIKVDDSFSLDDVCVKKQEEGGDDPYEQGENEDIE